MSTPLVKDILFTSVSNTPDDYSCADGDLDAVTDLISDTTNEGGSLVSAFPPKEVAGLPAGYRVLMIHTTLLINKNYIILDDHGGLYWSRMPLTAFHKIAIINNLRDISAIGNILCVATDDGLRMFLFKDDSYIEIPSECPTSVLEFGLRRMSYSNVYRESVIEGLPVVDGKVFFGSYRKDQEQPRIDLSTFVAGTILSDLSQCHEDGCFCLPFFVCYAFRLYDGSYVWHSAPVLMMPSVAPAAVEVDYARTDGSIRARSMLNPCALLYRILGSAIGDLPEDIFTSIDIFVSAPVYPFKADAQTVETQLRSTVSGPAGKGGNIVYRPGADGTYPEGSTPGSGSTDLKEVFNGLYIDDVSTTHDYHKLVAAGKQLLSLPRVDNFDETLTGCPAFYRVASISIAELNKGENFAGVPLEVNSLNDVTTLPSLPADYQSRFRKYPNVLYTYNSRLHQGDVAIRQPLPIPLRGCIQFRNSGQFASPVKVNSITVWSRHSGATISRTYVAQISTAGNEHDPFVLDSMDYAPQWFAVPDDTAFMVRLVTELGTRYLPLVAHPVLNCAYFFGGVIEKPEWPQVDSDSLPSDSCPEILPQPAKLYVSEVGNPLYYRADRIITIGSGQILALRSATTALSQGQFGSFPLYAFTSEGIWALQVNSVGGYSTSHPMSRDVCINPRGIVQTDDSVIFASARGVMAVSGSTVVELSAKLRSNSVFKVSSLPLLEDYLTKHGYSLDDIPQVSFMDYIHDALMAYDYANGRLFVFNPDYKYAYIYTLRSRSWTIARASLTSTVLSWPESLAMEADGSLVDLSDDDDSEESLLAPQSLLVTRPIKLSFPVQLKTLRSLIVRGLFCAGHVEAVVYASPDLFHWMPVSSSVSHVIRNFHGTPIKYFRLVLFCKLAKGESLSGFSLAFSPRLNNQLR